MSKEQYYTLLSIGLLILAQTATQTFIIAGFLILAVYYTLKSIRMPSKNKDHE